MLIDSNLQFILFRIPAGKAPFTNETDVLLCFTDKSGMVAVDKRLKAREMSFGEAIQAAGAAVFDPAPGIPERRVGIRGDQTLLPPGLGARVKIANEQGKPGTGKLGILPRDLEVDTLARLARPMVVHAPVPFGEAHYDFISIWKDEEEVGVYHRNGMTHSNALLALIRSGVIDGDECSDEDALTASCSYVVRSVHHERRFDGEPPRAPRRKSGTAPTSDLVRQRIEFYREILCIPEGITAVPSLNSDAIKVLKGLSDQYKERKAAGTLPASEAQIAYAKELSRRTGIPLPEQLTGRALGNFIEVARLEPTLD
ncbi:hypothetical protein HFO56_03265 [Rhizobium laguerreae]|uniref:hypothetical protein n=1 Tax=Rhizobium laguerreae TaxID=1076926 RepID=UPI001C8FBEAF|nr:hypothetical protein [Rhizobium laguerreae]MBY3151407.1 hypothetical protein [Rhizobium laguerreae]